MHGPVQGKGARRYGSRSWKVREKREVREPELGVQGRNGRYRSRGPTPFSRALMVLNNLLKYLQSKAKLCKIIALKHLRPWVHYIFSKGFVSKSRFKQQNDFAIFFSTKGNVTFHRLWDDTLVILSKDNGGLRRSGNFKWPFRGTKHTVWERGTIGAAFVHGKLLQQKGVKKRELLHVTDWYSMIISLAGED